MRFAATGHFQENQGLQQSAPWPCPPAQKQTCDSSEVIFTVDDSELLALERLITLLH